jgi:DNA polymerase III alpha subunit
MEPILRETKGVILFQEQFLKLAHLLTGLDLGEAEKLRKALGKTRSVEERAGLGSKFVSGAIERGIDQLQAQKVWEIVAGYSGFGFCAAHAHSYALTAYRSAYMKAHYPAEFLAAQINNGGGYYGPSVYVEEARRLHINVLVPHVNESGAWCEVPTGPGSHRTIRFGLQFVKGLSKNTIEALLTERRNNGRFRSLLDLMSRVPMEAQELLSLVKLGACDDLAATGSIAAPLIAPIKGRLGETVEAVHEPSVPLNRKQMMWLLPTLLSLAGLRARAMWLGRNSQARRMPATGSEGYGLQVMMGDLLGDQPDGGGAKVLGSATGHRRIEVPSLEEYTLSEKLKLEREALGFVLTCNEMELISPHGTVLSSKLRYYADRDVRISGVIAAGRSHTGKDGNKMLFLTVQDREGLIEVVVFSEAYKKHSELLASNGYGPYVITGLAQVSGKGRGIGVQPPSDLLMVHAMTLKMHPVVVAEKIEPMTL